jgi:hypothetical protein
MHPGHETTEPSALRHPEGAVFFPWALKFFSCRSLTSSLFIFQVNVLMNVREKCCLRSNSSLFKKWEGRILPRRKKFS